MLRNRLFILYALFFALAACGDLTDTGGHVSGDNSAKPVHLKKVSYADLPGWRDDDARYALAAFRNTCKAKIQYVGRVVPDKYLLEEKCQVMPAPSADNATVRAWFESHFQPYKIADESGKTKGVFTGYYSPTIAASRKQGGAYSEPLMGVPTDGRNFKGVDKKTIVQNRIGNVLYWAHPVDVQNIQIQGSGMLRLEDGTLVKLNFAAVNDLPFKSIGDQLIKRGIRPPEGYSAAAVWKYLKTQPALAREVIDNNPRYVYFKESPEHAVVGKLGTPLSKIRSIAVDDTIYTVGLPMFVDTYLSDNRKFQRLMVAQDTGSAIRGFVRADIFFGTGEDAEAYASPQYSNGEMYILMPKEYQYVKPTW
ncbi:MAG: MltA domain-containing protein [Proteobacteria bacterium]|nr:MltA domain-containing protein [Pseudomonadota bacterium]